MSASIAAALRDRLLADTTVNAITTTVGRARVREGATLPYIVLDQVGTPRGEKSSHGRFPPETWQFSCYATTDVSARVLAEAAFNAVNDAPLAVDGRKILQVDITMEVQVLMDDVKVWMGIFRMTVSSQILR